MDALCVSNTEDVEVRKTDNGLVLLFKLFSKIMLFASSCSVRHAILATSVGVWEC